MSESVLKEFDEDKEKDKRGVFEKDREVQEILNLAGRIAKDNPNLASALTRRAMRYPLGNSWYFTLYAMAEKNQPLADQIYGELLVNYADAEVYRLLYLAAYPFARDRIFGVEKYNFSGSVPANFSPNRNLQRQFLLALLRRISRLTPESTTKSLQMELPESVIAVMALNEIEPIGAQQFPDLAQAFSQARTQANSVSTADALEKAKKQDEWGKNHLKSYDEKLEDVKKAEELGTLTDFQIYQLISAAKTEENYAEAESWIEKMKDENAREGTKNYFFFKRSKLAAKEKRFDEARKFALKVGKIEHRTVLFFDIAEAKLKEPMTKLESLETLLEVYQTALKAPDTIEKAQILLGTAFMYEKIDALNAFNSLADAIKTANKLENPNLFTSTVRQQIQGKNFSAYSSFNVPGFDVSETFYALSQYDLQNALNYTTNFSDKYLRTLAVLATVKDCEQNDKPVKQKPKTK
jgi:hypothetical protein